MKRRKSEGKTVDRILAFAALLTAREAKRGDLEEDARNRLRELGIRVEIWDCAVTEIRRLESELERVSKDTHADSGQLSDRNN